jgi:hypothetical protein
MNLLHLLSKNVVEAEQKGPNEIWVKLEGEDMEPMSDASSEVDPLVAGNEPADDADADDAYADSDAADARDAGEVGENSALAIDSHAGNSDGYESNTTVKQSEYDQTAAEKEDEDEDEDSAAEEDGDHHDHEDEGEDKDDDVLLTPQKEVHG